MTEQQVIAPPHLSLKAEAQSDLPSLASPFLRMTGRLLHLLLLLLQLLQLCCGSQETTNTSQASHRMDKSLGVFSVVKVGNIKQVNKLVGKLTFVLIL